MDRFSLQKLQSVFFKGLFSLLPIALTIYILMSIVQLMDNVSGAFLRAIITEDLYIPGLGFILTIAIILALGFALDNFLVKRFVKVLERGLMGIPLIKAVYNPLRDLFGLFTKAKDSGMKSVVLVKLGAQNLCLGIVTRESTKDLAPLRDKTMNHIAVYIPLSYGVGGVTILVHRDQVEPINMPIEKALSLAITGWVMTESATVEAMAGAQAEIAVELHKRSKEEK